MFNNKKAFTFVELVVATTISAIVLLFTFGFVANSIGEISYSIKYSKILGSYNDFFIKLNNYRNIFSSGSILIDNPTGIGNDVLILKNLESTKGVIFGIINKETMKLETDSRYDYYYDKVLGYRGLSSSEITELNSTPINVYDYIFYNDKLFNNLRIKDFQVALYNTGEIINIDMGVNINYKKGLDGKKFNIIGTSNIDKFSLNF